MNTLLKNFWTKTLRHLLLSPLAVATLLAIGAIAAQAQIATGFNHTLAIQNNGTVWAWGYNLYGELGNNTTTEETTAVEVLTSSGTLSGVVDVAAGQNHSVAVDSTGNAWAWGYNQYGQLGTGNTTNSSVAVQMKNSSGNLTNIVAVAAGDNFTLALRNDGTVWAVGTNSNGQLGNGSTTQETLAVQVQTSSSTYLTNIVAVAAGTTHSMALDGNGNVWTWGGNASGQLGLGNTTQETYAQQVTAISGIVKIGAGASHSLAMTTNGATVYAWGYNNDGQLGNNTVTQEDSPITMIGVSNAKSVAGGANHSVVLKNDGTVWTVGHNYVGELGIGSTVDQHEAVQVPGVSGILTIAARGDRTLMYTNVGTILGVGDDFYSGLGDGKVGYQLSPYSVTALSGVTQVSSANNGYHSLAVTSGGAIYAAGWNNYGQLGNNSEVNSNTFAQVQTSTGYLTGITAGAAGSYHSLALTTSGGNVYAWGYGSYGQLGNGSNSTQQLPVEVVNSAGALANITAISAGEYHSLALRNDGTVWAWGYNSDGELGNNTTTNSNKALEVLNTSGTPLSNIVAIAAGSLHNLAVDSSGNLWAWGYNTDGELGDGTTTHHLEAEQINLSGTTLKAAAGAVSACRFCSMAITSTGTALAWGSNASGELGDGTTTNRLTPVAIENLTSVASISTGVYHAMATETNGSVWTWGLNTMGELGNGTYDLNAHDSPVQITTVTAASGAIPGSCGGYHNLLINSSGVLTSWADGMYGQLADGQFGYAASPVTANFTVTQDMTGLWVDNSVAPGGSGTFSSPYNTIASAVSAWNAGYAGTPRITIRQGSGPYYEQIYMNYYSSGRSGTAANPLIIRGMPGERAVVSGMRHITGWSQYNSNIDVASLGTWDAGNGVTNMNPNGPDTFYMGINGNLNEKLMAQSPNVGTTSWAMQSYTTGGGEIVITDTTHLSQYAANSLVGGYVQWSSTGNSVEGGHIISNNPTAGTITAGFTAANDPPLPSPNGTYIVKNSLQLLDQPGEWACVAQGDGTFKMYYWPETGETLADLNSTAQSRDGDYLHGDAVVFLAGVSYVTITGLEITGGSSKGNGVFAEGLSMTSQAQGINITWNLIHDNGGAHWTTYANGNDVDNYYGAGVKLNYCTNAVVSNNVSTLNFTGITVDNGCTNCLIKQNDIGYNYNDAIDVEGGSSTTLNTGTTISENYIHHNINLLQHSDSVQNDDKYIQGETIENNVMLDQDQITFANGFGGGELLMQGNVIWDGQIIGLGEYTGSYVVNDNTCNGFTTEPQLNPLNCNENVDVGRWGICSNNYTGDRNLVIPMPYTPSTYDTTQIETGTDGGNLPSQHWGYTTASPGPFMDLYNLFVTQTGTGQDYHSQVYGYPVPPPSTPQFNNMPTYSCSIDTKNNISKFMTNGTSTTVPLIGIGNVSSWLATPAQEFAMNDWIEVNRDGVLRQVSSVSTTNETITFSPPLSGFTAGDGLGGVNLTREDIVERWGRTKPTSIVRDTTLVAGSPGTTMSATGGPIGSKLSIPEFVEDNFDGSGPGEVPPLPQDVLTNQQRHSWHLSTWFSYGNN